MLLLNRGKYQERSGFRVGMFGRGRGRGGIGEPPAGAPAKVDAVHRKREGEGTVNTLTHGSLMFRKQPTFSDVNTGGKRRRCEPRVDDGTKRVPDRSTARLKDFCKGKPPRYHGGAVRKGRNIGVVCT